MKVAEFLLDDLPALETMFFHHLAERGKTDCGCKVEGSVFVLFHCYEF